MIRDAHTRMTDPEDIDCNGDVTAYYSELDDVPWEAEKYQVGNTVFYGFFARIAKKMDENGEWEETYCSCGEVLTSDAESISGECEDCMLSERLGKPGYADEVTVHDSSHRTPPVCQHCGLAILRSALVVGGMYFCGEFCRDRYAAKMMQD